MKKKLKICGKEYEVGTNALTPFMYKKQFGVGMLSDIGKLQEIFINQSKIDTKGKTEEEVEKELGTIMMPSLDNFMEVILRIAYILIKTCNREFMSFEAWLETIEEFNFGDEWIGEVTELAVSSFLGQGISGTAKPIKD